MNFNAFGWMLNALLVENSYKIGRKNYNHPHEKTVGHQQESPVFFIFCDYNLRSSQSNKEYNN